MPQEEAPKTRQSSRIAGNKAATAIAATKNSDLYTTQKGGQAELTGSVPYQPPPATEGSSEPAAKK